MVADCGEGWLVGRAAARARGRAAGRARGRAAARVRGRVAASVADRVAGSAVGWVAVGGGWVELVGHGSDLVSGGRLIPRPDGSRNGQAERLTARLEQIA